MPTTKDSGKVDNYIICATARSGSNLLCEFLTALKIAGKPFEHLWDPPGSAPEPLAVRWRRILEDGRGDNGVFATKLLWYQADLLERELPAALGRTGQPLSAILADTLENPRYVYLTRRDRIRQAVSFARAIQTEQWRSMDEVASPPRYDPDAVTAARRALADEEGYWEAFFARSGIVPHRLAYEDLDANPQAAVGAVLEFLGYDGSLPDNLASTEHRKQADAETEEWVRRYEREIPT